MNDASDLKKKQQKTEPDADTGSGDEIDLEDLKKMTGGIFVPPPPPNHNQE